MFDSLMSFLCSVAIIFFAAAAIDYIIPDDWVELEDDECM